MGSVTRGSMFAVLLVAVIPMTYGQNLPSREEIYNLTSQVLNATQNGLEFGTNVTEVAFNASVLFACQAANFFIDRSLYSAISAVLKGEGSTYPKMEQCVDGCLYFFASTVIKPVLRIAKLATPLPIPKPRAVRTYNNCYRRHVIFKDSCNLVNNMKRCLMNKLPIPFRFVSRHFAEWIEIARKKFKINYGILPLFPTEN